MDSKIKDRLDIRNGQFETLCYDLMDKFETKNANYGDDYFSGNYNEAERWMGVKRKIARLEAYHKNGSDLLPEETLLDTWEDLAVYCVMELIHRKYITEQLEYDCYIASGWFNAEQATDLENIKNVCKDVELKVFSPKDEILAKPDEDQETKKKIFEGNIEAIKKCKFVIVNTRGKDLGTLFECGFSFANKKPIIYYCEGLKGNFNLMLSESGRAVATTTEELKKHLEGMKKNKNYYVPYKGLIE